MKGEKTFQEGWEKPIIFLKFACRGFLGQEREAQRASKRNATKRFRYIKATPTGKIRHSKANVIRELRQRKINAARRPRCAKVFINIPYGICKNTVRRLSRTSTGVVMSQYIAH